MNHLVVAAALLLKKNQLSWVLGKSFGSEPSVQSSPFTLHNDHVVTTHSQGRLLGPRRELSLSGAG